MLFHIIRILKTFFLFMVIDGAWLMFMGERFYKYHLAYLFADSFQYSWAILFYLLYAVAVNYFIIVPAMMQSSAIMNLFLQGFLFGLVVYSAYDLTNQATIKNWPLIVTIIDMLWGATLTGLVVILTYRFSE